MTQILCSQKVLFPGNCKFLKNLGVFVLISISALGILIYAWVLTFVKRKENFWTKGRK